MTDKVWMSSVLSNYALSIDQGIRNKYYGHDWEEARIDGMNSPEEAHEARVRNERGFALCREDFPEASAVWNEKMYSKVHDFFRIGPFHAVKGKTAEVLSRFDLGHGGLIRYPIYKADLETPMDGEFFLLNFGARKDSFLPEQSENVVMRGVRAATGQQIWKINSWHGDGDVALAPSALEGSDLWFEEVVSYGGIFMSDALAQALIDIGQKDLFALKKCQIVGDVA
jgi:hypothetical protein